MAVRAPDLDNTHAKARYEENSSPELRLPLDRRLCLNGFFRRQGSEEGRQGNDVIENRVRKIVNEFRFGVNYVLLENGGAECRHEGGVMGISGWRPGLCHEPKVRLVVIPVQYFLSTV